MYTERPRGGDIGNTILWAGAIAVVLAVVLALVFALDWFAAPMQVMSPRNVQMLSREANESWQGLQAQRATIEAQQRRADEFDVLYGADPAKWPQGKRAEYQQVTSALRNLVAAYNLSCGDYNAMWQDEWRDVPAPNDLPRSCELMVE